MDKVIKIGIVEDQVLFREGIKAVLHSWPYFNVVMESPDGYSLSERLLNMKELPDVLLVDLSLPPFEKKEFNGLHVTITLTENFPTIKILILSVHNDENFIAELIKNGAHGYLVKDSDPQEVHDAIMAVYSKGSYFNTQTLKAVQSSMANKIKQKKLIVNLSSRELEVLQLICQQYTAEEIAEKLFLSVKTVNGHRNNLLIKTGSRNVAGLVVYAAKNDIIKLI